MKRYYKVATLLWCILNVSSAFAQLERDQNGEIPDEEVVIIKEKELKLPEAIRNFEKVTIPVKPAPVQAQKYAFQDFKVVLPPVEPRMSVARLPQDELSKLYGTYVKGGVGNYATTYLELFHNSKRTNDYAYGVHAKHLATPRGVSKVAGNSDNRFAGYGQYFNEKYVLGGRLHYSRERYNFFGYDNAEKLNKDSLRQIYNNIAFEASIQNATDSAKFAYTGNLNFSNFGDNQKQRESEFGASFLSKYKLSETGAIVADIEIALMQYRADTLSQGRNYTNLRPAYFYKKDKLELTVGANFAFANDKLPQAKKAYVYPNVHANYQLIEGKLTLMGGVFGNLEKHTFRNFVAENPFVDSMLTLAHTSKNLDVYVGVKGAASSSLSYAVSGGFQSYDMLPFWVSNTEDYAKYILAYDSSSTKVTRFSAEIAYNQRENLRVSLKADYYGYKLSQFKEAWHRPSFKTSFNAKYHYRNKVFLNFDVYYMGTQFAPEPRLGTIAELKGLTDIDLKIDYKFSEKFSVFLEMDNILSQKNQRYLYYQNRGLLVLLGASASL